MSDNTVTEENFIDFKCPHCAEQVSFPASCAGLVRECFNCLEPLIVPTAGEVGGIVPLPVTGSRVVLRRFRGQDWKDLLAMISDEEFLAVSTLGIETEEAVTLWLEADTAVKLTSPGAVFTLAIEAPEKNKVVGYVSLRFSDAEQLQAQLYLVIHRADQRSGFGAGALKGAISFCFDGLSLHRLHASCDSTNAAACALLQKCGLRREGEFVKDHKVRGEWANTSSYAILREEWPARATQ